MSTTTVLPLHQVTHLKNRRGRQNAPCKLQDNDEFFGLSGLRLTSKKFAHIPHTNSVKLPPVQMMVPTSSCKNLGSNVVVRHTSRIREVIASSSQGVSVPNPSRTCRRAVLAEIRHVPSMPSNAKGSERDNSAEVPIKLSVKKTHHLPSSRPNSNGELNDGLSKAVRERISLLLQTPPRLPSEGKLKRWTNLLGQQGMTEEQLQEWTSDFQTKCKNEQVSLALVVHPPQKCTVLLDTSLSLESSDSSLSKDDECQKSASCSPKQVLSRCTTATSSRPGLQVDIGRLSSPPLVGLDMERLNSPPLFVGSRESILEKAEINSSDVEEEFDTDAVDGQEMLSLVYDDLLMCFYDRKSGKYYQLATPPHEQE